MIIFVTGIMEAAIKLVMVNKTILTDLKLQDHIKANSTFSVIKKVNLSKLDKPNCQASTADKDTLRGSVTNLQTDTFNHFKKLLLPCTCSGRTLE
jgi:hypothetical protein